MFFWLFDEKKVENRSEGKMKELECADYAVESPSIEILLIIRDPFGNLLDRTSQFICKD